MDAPPALKVKEGAVAEPAWNDSLLFDNTGNRHTASIVNKGTLYMAAEEGHTMRFLNASPDSSSGTLVVGTDVMMNGSPAITLLLPQAEPTELMVQQPGMVMFALPEPATATLSLLAPAALCVRRR